MSLPKTPSSKVSGLVKDRYKVTDSGLLIAKKDFYKTSKGSVVGTKSPDKYLRVYVGGKNLLVHRVIWFLRSGFWPKETIDHINGDRSDNSIQNLREISNISNVRAYNRQSKVSSSIYRGVSKRSEGKWFVTIHPANTSIYLGTFTCELEAALAYNYRALDLGYLPEAFNGVFKDES